jgi:uncharacterized protein YqgC (DUF456 family)
MDVDSTTLVIIGIASLLGMLFTVVPVVPGTLFIPAGAVVIGFVQGWDVIPVWLWVVQALLVVVYLLIDNLAQIVGVKRIGGSRGAMAGGAIGVFVGPLALGIVSGPLGLLLGPPIGAVAGTLIGEERSRRRAGAARASTREYSTLGVGALAAFVVSVMVKLLLITVQVVVLLVAV